MAIYRYTGGYTVQGLASPLAIGSSMIHPCIVMIHHNNYYNYVAYNYCVMSFLEFKKILKFYKSEKDC